MKNYDLNDKIFNFVNYLIMLVLIVATLYPFLHVLAVSFTILLTACWAE